MASNKERLPESVSARGEGVVDTEGKSRKDVIRGLAAAAAGAIAGGVLSAENARASHGTLNAYSSGSAPAIHGDHTNVGVGVEGSSGDGVGVYGRSSTGVAVDGLTSTGVGVRGSGRIGVEGVSLGYAYPAIGVRGETGSATDPAVLGINTDVGPGVKGTSKGGTGVEGTSTGGSSTGVLGQSDAGTAVRAISQSFGVYTTGVVALRAEGQAQFSTVGSGVIPANQGSVFVSASFVTVLSHISVTLTGDPGQAGSVPGFKPVVVWVERQPGAGGFVVHMSKPVRVDTPFTYFVVDPA